APRSQTGEGREQARLGGGLINKPSPHTTHYLRPHSPSGEQLATPNHQAGDNRRGAKRAQRALGRPAAEPAFSGLSPFARSDPIWLVEARDGAEHGRSVRLRDRYSWSADRRDSRPSLPRVLVRRRG